MHRAYTFYDIEFQVGMRDAEKCKQYEQWLVNKFAGDSEFSIEGPDGYHVTKSIDFRNKPHLSYDYVGPDGFRNYLVMCGESVSDMCTCLKEFIKLVEGNTESEKDHNVINWLV